MHRLLPFRPALLSRALLAGSFALLCTLAGCSQEKDSPATPTASADTAAVSAAAPAPPTTSATLQRAELMTLVFGSRHDEPAATRAGTVQLPRFGDDGKAVPGSKAEQNAQVSAREVVRLDDTHAVLLAEVVPLDDQGRPMDSHVSGAWLGAYFFEQGPKGWSLAKRNDAVDYLGFYGNMGTTRVERIAPQRFVLTITNDSCWQGYCGRWLAVYELGPGDVRELIDSIRLAASNVEGDGACAAVLDAAVPETPPRGECFDISGTPQFTLGTDEEPGGLRVAFSGKRTAGAEDRPETVDSAVVYAYRGNTYVLTEGRNPVPSF